MEEMTYNKHYITVDERGRIVDGWSDGPHPERGPSGAVCINKQGGYQFRLAPAGEENPVLHSEDMVPLYKYKGGQIIPRTAEEIEADRAVLPVPEEAPSQLDLIEAQVTYTAMMTDTLLEV